VLYHRGTPAGYSELNFISAGQVKLEYFGLFPEFIGRGLGGWFLDWTVHQAWRPGVRRIWVHTCTLDHPNALPVYQKAGFQIYNRVTAPNPYL
jgi:GNAT superfamily N-acetyltransferase